MKKQIMGKKGITLIALVITIIVLLILAGVAIATLTGDNGILQKVGAAKNTNTDTEIEEEIRLAWNKVYMDSYLNSTTDKANALKTELEKNGHTVESVSASGTKITIINYRGKNKKLDVSTGTVEEKKIGIGDLITKDNYGNFIDLRQSVVRTDSSADDWRILFNDQNEHVYAILSDYLPNNNPAVMAAGFSGGQVSFTYGVNSLYDSDLRAKLNDTNAWKTLISTELQKKGALVTGATTAEILIASYNDRYGKSLNYTSNPTLYIDGVASKGVDSLYVPHPSTSEDCYGFWLATSGGYKKTYNVARNGYISPYTSGERYCGLCPVVMLPFDLQATKSTSNETTIWTISL